MGFVNGNTMIEFKDKIVKKIDDQDRELETLIKDSLTPTLVGTGKIVANVIDEYNGVAISIPDLSETGNGIYLFTYAYCMIFLPVYGFEPNRDYKIAATLCDINGSYKVKVLTYRCGEDNKLYIYQKENYMPVGFDTYLFKIKLY